MFIFALLGLILDEDTLNGCADETITKGKDTLTITFKRDNDKKYAVLSLLDILMEEDREMYIELHKFINNYKENYWYTVSLVFGKNPNCNKGELQKIIFENSDCEELIYYIAKKIVNILGKEQKDYIYFEMCNEILHIR